MAPVSMPPVEEARSVFSRLGYTVSGDGVELRAERKWRTVHVLALDGDVASGPNALPDGGMESDDELRCFVTWAEHAGNVRTYLERIEPTYDWAIIGVDEDANYDVIRPTGTRASS